MRELVIIPSHASSLARSSSAYLMSTVPVHLERVAPKVAGFRAVCTQVALIRVSGHELAAARQAGAHVHGAHAMVACDAHATRAYLTPCQHALQLGGRRAWRVRRRHRQDKEQCEEGDAVWRAVAAAVSQRR